MTRNVTKDQAKEICAPMCIHVLRMVNPLKLKLQPNKPA